MSRMERWFADARVRSKILVGYGLILVFMVLITVVVLIQTTQIDRLNAEAMGAAELQVEGEQIGLALADRTAAYRGYLLTGADTALVAYRDANDRLNTGVQRGLELVETPTQRERLIGIGDLARAWEVTAAEPGIALRSRALRPGGPSLEAVAEFSRTAALRDEATRARALLRDFKDVQARVANDRAETLRLAVERIRAVTLLATLVAAVLGLLVAFWIARRIARPLEHAATLAQTIASGNLTETVPVLGNDEVGQLSATLNGMAADLRATIAQVESATTQVASAAEQIAATSQSISETVDDQVRSTEETSSSMEQIAAQIARVARSAESLASSVEQTSSSIGQMSQSIEQTAGNVDSLGSSVEQTSATIEQMVASINQVGRHVRETRDIARSAQADARMGGDAVARMTEGMERIHGEMETLVERIRALGNTGEVIGRVSDVLEDIADQTNLLALNAAIEAARAGEQGRGFAVVAQEIRRLAERSVESAREIGTTVRGVRAEVGRVVETTDAAARVTQQGIVLAAAGAEALQKIISSSARTRDLMEEVGLATEQQVSAAEQAQQAVRHIHNITEQARIATREQAHASRQIVDSVESMNRETQEVFAATAEQKRGGDLVLQATETISDGARVAQHSVVELVEAAADLSAQASDLTVLVRQFRV